MYCPPQAGFFGIFDFIARCARRIQRPGVFFVAGCFNAVLFSVALAARNISERRNRIFGLFFYIIRRSKNIFLIFSHNHLTGLDLNDIIVNCIIIA